MLRFNFTAIFILLGFSLAFAQVTDGKITTPEPTEVWEPQPRVVETKSSMPPSDAIVLFDGKAWTEWVATDKDTTPAWKIEKGHMTVVAGAGNIQTRRDFGSIQLHIEWRSPKEVEGEGQGRGNSGVFLQKRYEVQVLDNYQNKTYANGQAGAVYKQHIPLVNACRPPGEWQSYDIIYMAPAFNEDGIKVRPATLTLLHNGVLVQNHVEIMGSTEYIGLPQNEAHGKAPIMLQDHGNPVSYRNIWVREL